jgi:hypothetical protein
VNAPAVTRRLRYRTGGIAVVASLLPEARELTA